MLHSWWLTYKFHIAAQSGFYVDFLYKKLSEIFVRNIFIYASQFFGEKFMIETWTKKFFFLLTQHFATFISVSKQNYFWFFFHILVISIYIFCIVFLLCFLI